MIELSLQPINGEEMPTLDQLKAFLTSMGVPLAPDFVLQAILDEAAAVEQCLIGAGYSDSKILLIMLYLMGLMSIPGSSKYISSQTAPSGASQSFRYTNETDAFNNVRGLLYNLDKSGCTDGLIPVIGTSAGLWVSTGGKCC